MGKKHFAGGPIHRHVCCIFGWDNKSPSLPSQMTRPSLSSAATGGESAVATLGLQTQAARVLASVGRNGERYCFVCDEDGNKHLFTTTKVDWDVYCHGQIGVELFPDVAEPRNWWVLHVRASECDQLIMDDDTTPPPHRVRTPPTFVRPQCLSY